MHKRLLEPPDVIDGEYRLRRPIGVGGSGAVYQATRVSDGEACAVKVMHACPVDGASDARRRFIREANLLRAMGGQHVVKVYAAGVDEHTSTPWIAMELLSGVTLNEYVRERGALSLPLTDAFMRQLAAGLKVAHNLEIIHRDVKPHNVLVLSSERFPPRLKLIDFGFSKMIQGTSASISMVGGSPAWMSPEQADGQGRITKSTDVWSLGLIAFLMLTGRSFWLAANRDGGSVDALLMEVLSDPIPSASERARQLDTKLVAHPRLDAWFARCLARRPERRFPSAHEALVGWAALQLGGGNGDDMSASRRSPPRRLVERRAPASEAPLWLLVVMAAVLAGLAWAATHYLAQ